MAEVSDSTVGGSVLCQGTRRSLNPCGNWLPLPPRLEYMGTWINRAGNAELGFGKHQLLLHHVCRKHSSYLVPVDNGQTQFSMIFRVLRAMEVAIYRYLEKSY